MLSIRCEENETRTILHNLRWGPHTLQQIGLICDSRKTQAWNFGRPSTMPSYCAVRCLQILWLKSSREIWMIQKLRSARFSKSLEVGQNFGTRPASRWTKVRITTTCGEYSAMRDDPAADGKSVLGCPSTMQKFHCNLDDTALRC